MNYPSFPPHFVPVPPPKKPIPTWVIVLGTLATCLAFAVFVGGLFAWRTWRSISLADRTEVKGVADESWRAGGAPGAAEVHQLGCLTSVVDIPTMPSLASEYAMGPLDGTPQPLDVDVVVECVAYDEPPTCDEVATTYVDAVRVEEPFRVVVQNPRHAVLCNSKFDSDGVKLAALGD